MSVNTIVCIPDLVIIKYFGNNTIEIKRIVFTYPDLLPPALVVKFELIHVYRTVGILLLWNICDVRPMSKFEILLPANLLDCLWNNFEYMFLCCTM